MERLRGVNLGGWFSQIDAVKKNVETFPGIEHHINTFLAESDFVQIKAWGFNHVRLPIDHSVVFHDDLIPNEDRLALLDHVIKMAAKHELTLILDLHKCPGNDFHEGHDTLQTLFTDPQRLDETRKIWACLAERFGVYEHVLLEILNEPVAPNNAAWNTIKDSLCRHIRQYAPNSPIIVGSNLWNSAETFSDLTPVEDENIIYNVHMYIPLQFTHQLAPWIKDPRCQIARLYPGDYGDGMWNKDRLKQVLEPVLKFRQNYQIPVICDEFGTYVQADRNSQLRWMSDVLEIFQEEEIGFSYWSYKNMDFGIISQGEYRHANLPQYNNPEHMDRELLALLQRL